MNKGGIGGSACGPDRAGQDRRKDVADGVFETIAEVLNE